MPAIAEPPVAPAAPASPSAPAAAVPAIPQPVAFEPPRPGSARESMFKELRKKASAEEPAATPVKPVEAKPAEPAAVDPKAPSEPKEPASPKPGDKKVSPWRLVDDYKAKVTALEQQLAEAKKSSLPEAEVKTIRERLEGAEKRARELEEHIRFVDYSKSQEFAEKYQKPYEKAWERAMIDLGELTVGEGAAERPLNAEDLLTLVNMPLGQARDLAEKVFGNFADDVMAHRKEIKRLFDEQSAALEEAKKGGAERQKRMQEEFHRTTQELTAMVSEEWKRANEEAANHEKVGQYFKPVEGDEESNQALQKGFELVDRAFSANPLDPRLTPEQRKLVVRSHVAVRNRAAAFGRMVRQIEQLKACEAELSKELAQYKATEPVNEPPAGAPAGGASAPASARSEVFGALRKLAK